MIPLIKNNKAISALLSTLLFVVLIAIAASLLFIFTNESMDNFMEEASKRWKLQIGNVGFNQSCIRVHVINVGEKNATLENVYINDELRAFRLLDNNLNIPIDSGKEIYVFGNFNPGHKYKIKIVFESGYTIATTERY